jgi:tetratricopeptide (TPR) repeat protein
MEMTTRGWAIHGGAIAAISLLAVAIYSNSWNAEFVYDDVNSILTNEWIRVTELGFGSLRDAAFESRLPRPVAYLTFALNYYVSGYEVWSYHFVNVAIHAVNGVLVYALAHLLLGRWAQLRGREDSALILRWAPVVTALLFTAHPVQTQAVTYVVQRMASLASLFYLLSLLLYILGRRGEPGARRWTLWGAALVSWLLALGSKEIAAVLPYAVLLTEWYFFQDLSRAWLRRWLPLIAVLVLVSLGIAWAYVDGPLAPYRYPHPYYGFTLPERLMTQLRVVVFYAGLLLWPSPGRLNLIHTIETSHSLFDPATTALSLLLAAGTLGLAVVLASRWRLASFCVLWFFLHLAVESSVLPLEMIYEHRLYLPVFGVALGVSALLFAAARTQPKVAFAISMIVVTVLASTTYVRNRVWIDGLTLWSDVVAKSPGDHRAHYSLGVARAKRGRTESAIAALEQAIRLEPKVLDAHARIGAGRALQGRFEEAAEHFRAELRRDPAAQRVQQMLTAAERAMRDKSSAP